MKYLIFLALISCGKPSEKCTTREAKRLECRAEEAAKYYYNTDYALEQQRLLCERLFQINQCY